MRKHKWVSLKKAIGTEKSLLKGKKVLVDREFVTQALQQFRGLLKSGDLVWPEWSPKPIIKPSTTLEEDDEEEEEEEGGEDSI